MTPEQQLRSSVAKREAVMVEDVVKMFSLALEATENVKKQLETLVESKETNTSKELESVIGEIKDLERDINALSEKVGEVKLQTDKEISTAVNEVLAEVKRIQNLIPTIPLIPDIFPLERRLTTLESRKFEFPIVDLEPLQNKILEIEARLPFPTEEITPELIRDKLESLTESESLDVTAIRNAQEKITISPNPPENPVKHQLWIKV